VTEPKNQPDPGAQNPAQSATVNTGNDQNEAQATNEKRPDLPADTSPFRYLHDMQVTPTGFEHASDSTGEQQAPLQGGAFSGALSGEFAPELAEVARAWTALPAAVRTRILAMVRAVKR
jgi:hypothetical protein